jgi:hypothetical protein
MSPVRRGPSTRPLKPLSCYIRLLIGKEDGTVLPLEHVVNWLRSVEVDSGGEDYIPEFSRVISGSMNLDFYKNRVRVYCVQRKGPTDADLIFREEFLTW